MIRSMLVRSLKTPIGRVLARTSTKRRSMALVVLDALRQIGLLAPDGVHARGHRTLPGTSIAEDSDDGKGGGRLQGASTAVVLPRASLTRTGWVGSPTKPGSTPPPPSKLTAGGQSLPATWNHDRPRTTALASPFRATAQREFKGSRRTTGSSFHPLSWGTGTSGIDRSHCYRQTRSSQSWSPASMSLS